MVSDIRLKDNKTTQQDVYDVKNGAQSAICENCTQNCGQFSDADKVAYKTRKKEKRAHKNAKLEKGSFVSLLVRSFVSFSLIIILGVVAIFSIVSWAVNDATKTIGEKTIVDYTGELAQGKYSSVPSTRLFGKNGWLDIVDTKGNIVYSTRSNKNKYSAGELDAIQKFDRNNTLTVHEFKMVDDKYYCLITRTFVDDSGAKQEQFMLLDYNHNVIEHTIPTNKDKYNELEFACSHMMRRTTGRRSTKSRSRRRTAIRIMRFFSTQTSAARWEHTCLSSSWCLQSSRCLHL